MSDYFMSEEAYREMQSENARTWADQFNTYDEACRFYGLPTPAQERAEAEYEEEQWWNSLSHEEQRQYIVRFLYECEYAAPCYIERYQPEPPVKVALGADDDVFAPEIELSPIEVMLTDDVLFFAEDALTLESRMIVHKQLWMNDLTPDGREIGYINVWKDRVPVVRIGLTNRWVIDVEAIRAMQQAQ